MELERCCESVAEILGIPVRTYDSTGALLHAYRDDLQDAVDRDEGFRHELLNLAGASYPAIHLEHEVMYGIVKGAQTLTCLVGPARIIEALHAKEKAPAHEKYSSIHRIALRPFCEGLILLNECAAGRSIDYHELLTLNFQGDPARSYLLTPMVRQSDSYLIANCKDEISLHLTEKITVQSLAEALNVNPSYLSRAFSREQGITITDYVKREKVRHAQSMLLLTDYSGETIAYQLGFSSSSYFVAVFKQEVGMTPGEYRRQRRSALKN